MFIPARATVRSLLSCRLLSRFSASCWTMENHLKARVGKTSMLVSNSTCNDKTRSVLGKHGFRTIEQEMDLRQGSNAQAVV